MNINRWLREDKGGFGAFLIVVIMGLTFYALQRKAPVATYDLPPTETEKATSARQVVDRKPFTATPFSDSAAEAESAKTDSALVAKEKEAELAKAKKVAENKKSTTKAKPRPTRKKISNKELVRSKLRAGMSVRQIAKATGLEKKYIREIKKRKECNCPG